MKKAVFWIQIPVLIVEFLVVVLSGFEVHGHMDPAFFIVNTFTIITALYKSLTQDTGFLYPRLCATCVPCMCCASKSSTFYRNSGKLQIKENP